jgi:hypothetical protein
MGASLMLTVELFEKRNSNSTSKLSRVRATAIQLTLTRNSSAASMKSLRILVATCLVAASFTSAIRGEVTNVLKWNPKTEKFDLVPKPTNLFKWSPNTERLDLIAKLADEGMGDPHKRDSAITLARDVKKFYQLLRDKQWPETYELRAKAFRKDIPKSDYLAETRKAEKIWGLVNYEVLSVGFSNSLESTNIDQAELICKFVELPDYATSYSTVFWHREDGVWRCLSAGPFKLDIFRGTRPPFIDWR